MVREEFESTSAPDKVFLGIGAYRDNNGKPWVLNSVHAADSKLYHEDMDYEYAPIMGNADFYNNAAKLLFGEGLFGQLTKNKQLVSSQTISGTGALRVAFEMIKRWKPDAKKPTWPNHEAILKNVGLEYDFYTYLDKDGKALDFDGMVKSLKKKANRNAVVLLHTCAHNPTGVDPTEEQWGVISDIIRDQEQYTVFDTAYQGFATGDLDNDAKSLRMFVDQGHFPIVCQSFAKNFGLYNQRAGAVHLTLPSGDDVYESAKSNLKNIIRPMYSNPPMHGARIVNTILQDQDLTNMWYNQQTLLTLGMQILHLCPTESRICVNL